MAQSRDLRQFLSERGRRTMLWLWRNYSDIIKTISQIFWTCSGDDGLRCTQTIQKEECFNKHSLWRLRKEYSLHDTITFYRGHLKIRRNNSDIIKTISQIFLTCSGDDGLRCTKITQKEVCFNKHSLWRLRKEYSLHDTITFNRGHLKIRH